MCIGRRGEEGGEEEEEECIESGGASGGMYSKWWDVVWSVRRRCEDVWVGLHTGWWLCYIIADLSFTARTREG